MICPSDPEYLDTKRIKQGKSRLSRPHRALADWIAATYQVTVLNTIRDSIMPDGRPRLQVVLEWAEDARTFKSRDKMNYDEDKQEAVKQQYMAAVGEPGPSLQRLLVCFSAFEPIAVEEALSKITEKESQTLKAKINHPDIWVISKTFATVLFHTQAQVEQHQGDELATRLNSGYWRLLAPHDEFGYLRRRGFALRFDSKENFDQAYGGNWFYYSRDH